VASDAGTRDGYRDNLSSDSGTVGRVLEPFPELSTTQTAAAELTEGIGFGRARARDLSEEYGDLHKQSLFAEWRIKTAVRGKAAPAELLTALGDLGFAWRDVARLVGVSVAAVQKWRRSSGVSGESRRKLASLLAACDLITEHYGVSEIASWFEMPLVDNAPVTPLDLYAAGQHKLIFEYGSGHVEPEQVLTEFDPDWREHYSSDFEVFRADDGELSIRPKEH
jgi:hypothetical protein